MAGAVGSEPSRRRKSSSSDSKLPCHALQVKLVLESERWQCLAGKLRQDSHPT